MPDGDGSPTGPRREPNWGRFPRWAYWIVGGGLAFGGAVGARTIGDTMPLDYRIWVWLAGSAVIFLGLCVVALGSRARRDVDNG